MFKIAVAALAAIATFHAYAAEPPVAPTPSQEQVIAQFRSDVLAQKADVMAKGLTLTADQAAKFWPLFQQFQDEQTKVIDGQIDATKKYSDHFASLTDADALDYVNALLTRDQAMHDLRVKWLAKFQTVVPAKIAARAIQLDRRLSQVAQVKVSQQIPLIP
jgi:Spy/CpxP family protein refolding chaperone